VAGLNPDDLLPDGAGDSPSQGFVQVKLTDKRRGGLLGQASILTLTANGVDTSPVIRGIWLLENILGAPPSPPPPNVPVVEPDIRGTTTLRQRLEKHRENAACAGCHRQIDPPGFALESFDAIGRWRGHYNLVNDKALPVDPSGEFNGHEFKDVVGFKKALVERQPQFARCLVSCHPPYRRTGRRRRLSAARSGTALLRERTHHPKMKRPDMQFPAMRLVKLELEIFRWGLVVFRFGWCVSEAEGRRICATP
jgi:hypothetical protein